LFAEQYEVGACKLDNLIVLIHTMLHVNFGILMKLHGIYCIHDLR